MVKPRFGPPTPTTAPAAKPTSTVPDGSVTTIAYAGNSVTTTDPAGIWKKNVMDAFGNLTAVYEPDPATGSATTGPVTNYTYNGANQLTNVSMVRGTLTQTRTFTYSGLDLASETTPEAGTVTYAYDGIINMSRNVRTHWASRPNTATTLTNACLKPGTMWSGTFRRGSASITFTIRRFRAATLRHTWGRLSAVEFQGPNAVWFRP